MRLRSLRGKSKIVSALLSPAIDAANAIRWTDLGVHPIIFSIGPFSLRWYSLAYLAGILIGWWYLLKLIDRPGAPIRERRRLRALVGEWLTP